MTPPSSPPGPEPSPLSSRRQRLAALCGLLFWSGLGLACLQKRSKTKEPTEPAKSPADGEPLGGSAAVVSSLEDVAPSAEGSPLPAPLGGGQASCLGPSNQLAWDKLPAAPEAYEARLIAYGDEASALIAIEFPKYQHGDLSELLLVDAQGGLIALRGIVEHKDVREDLRLRPILFDNLALSKGQGVGLILHTSDDSYYSYRLPRGVEWQTRFLNLAVYSLAASQQMVQDDFSHLPTPVLTPEASQFPFSQDEDAIVSVGEMGRLKETSALSAYTITDVMGNILARPGEAFTPSLSHDVLVCYKLILGKYYLRSLISWV